MAKPKITYENKEDVKLSSLPRKNKVIATDLNEIKEVVNSAIDDIETVEGILNVAVEDIEDAQTELQRLENEKQNTLVSGTNIKTLNGDSLLDSGNIEIISENLATNNLNLPATTERTFNIPSDSTLDFGALMKLYGTGIVDFTSDVTVDNVQFKGGVGT
ncbi:MAG: hypothetical protein RLZZ414_1081, partial [Bacteroidota bacterium]